MTDWASVIAAVSVLIAGTILLIRDNYDDLTAMDRRKPASLRGL